MAFCTNCGKKLLDSFDFCPECGTKVCPKAGNANGFGIPFDERRGRTKICRYCGAEIPNEIVYCLNCGRMLKENYINYRPHGDIKRKQTEQWRNKWIAFVLCCFFGWLGVHRFYEGKILTGLLYLFTLCFFGIGWFIDMIRILLKPNPYRTR